MIHVIVYIHVKQEYLLDFLDATMKNVLQSREEPGISRFDFLQNREDPFKFVLIEVYRDDDAIKKHKATSHYMEWRDHVASMMLEPRFSEKYKFL